MLEGGNAYGDIWRHEAARRGVEVLQIDAKVWRGQLLYAREQQSGPGAKKHAGELARQVIAWSGAAPADGPAARHGRGDPDRPVGRRGGGSAARAAGPRVAMSGGCGRETAWEREGSRLKVQG